MKVHEIPGVVDGKLLTKSPENREINGGYTSDLLSDVMGNASEGNVLITIQGHKNTVAVAQLVGLPAIVLCNGRPAPEDMVTLAEEEQIALISTKINQFEASNRLGRAMAAESRDGA